MHTWFVALEPVCLSVCMYGNLQFSVNLSQKFTFLTLKVEQYSNHFALIACISPFCSSKQQARKIIVESAKITLGYIPFLGWFLW